MKRANGDVVGRPSAAGASRDVAGIALPVRPLAHRDVASYKHALSDPMGTINADEDLMAEFDEFISADLSLDGVALPPPDPVFRERLRRRLWRTHVMAHLRDGGETH